MEAVTIRFVPKDKSIIPRVSTNLCLILLSLFVSLAVGEVFLRSIDYDFASGEERAWRQVPIFFRVPMAPSGETFFKRPGSEQWTGQVLNTRLKQVGVLPNPYANEPVITVAYDRKGFRNPEPMTDWAIAVAGDSFTELGYLPDEQLFTSRLARILNVSVLNLGTSYTGPLTQLSYLNDYGIAASTKHTIIVFYESNDLKDLGDEYKELLDWKATGQRPQRDFTKQTSLVKALYKVVQRVWKKPPHPVTAYFKSPQGDIPLTIRDTPPGRGQISRKTMHRLNYFFKQYETFGKDRQVTVWLAYMPGKRRVLHNQIVFTASATKKIQNWQPTDLPEVISELCDQYGIKFIDLTPTLNRATIENKQLMYNSMYDTHLNSHGALVVGQELARQVSRPNR